MFILIGCSGVCSSVELGGAAGASFDIIFDTQSQMVKSELVEWMSWQQPPSNQRGGTGRLASHMSHMSMTSFQTDPRLCLDSEYLRVHSDKRFWTDLGIIWSCFDAPRSAGEHVQTQHKTMSQGPVFTEKTGSRDGANMEKQDEAAFKVTAAFGRPQILSWFLYMDKFVPCYE